MLVTFQFNGFYHHGNAARTRGVGEPVCCPSTSLYSRRTEFGSDRHYAPFGLGANYRGRREVLESFGYHVPWDLPSETEIAEVRALVASELEDSTLPVYLVDYGQRLLA